MHHIGCIEQLSDGCVNVCFGIYGVDVEREVEIRTRCIGSVIIRNIVVGIPIGLGEGIISNG
jgi:hypothetical protein